MSDYKIIYHDDTIEIITNVEKLMFCCDLFKFTFKGGKWHIIEASIIKELSTV